MDLPTISYSIDLSLLIILLGVIFLYFGKLISEQKPELTSSYEVYITGFYFSYTYILLPIFIVITALDIMLSGVQFSALVRQIVPLLLLLLMADFIKTKWKWWIANKFNVPEELLEKGIQEEAEKSRFSKIFGKKETEDEIKKGVRFWRAPISPRLLFLINVVSLLIIIYIIIQEEEFLFFKGFSLLLYIFILSLSAALYGSLKVRYSHVKITQKIGDGAINIEGYLFAIDKDFVTLFSDNRIVHISRASILSIETGKIWKEE